MSRSGSPDQQDAKRELVELGKSDTNTFLILFVSPEWRRVKFLKLADDRVHYRDKEETRSIAFDPYDVAPARYFTDHVSDVPRPETADLLDSCDSDIGVAKMIFDISQSSGPADPRAAHAPARRVDLFQMI